jgi:uncharacterized BrkB/YihY/UPF0761 family membrane protein
MENTSLSRHSRLLTFAILFTQWSASSGFTALIDALNTAYMCLRRGVIGKLAGLLFSLHSRLDVCSSLLSECCVVGPSLGAWLTETFGLRNF